MIYNIDFEIHNKKGKKVNFVVVDAAGCVSSNSCCELKDCPH